jgi:hypothetical protein
VSDPLAALLHEEMCGLTGLRVHAVEGWCERVAARLRASGVRVSEDAGLRALLNDATTIFADSEGHSVSYVDGDWKCDPDCPAHVWLAKARAALRSEDAAPLCGDDSWDTRYSCVKPKGHPVTGPGLIDHDYQYKAGRSTPAAPQPDTDPSLVRTRAMTDIDTRDPKRPPSLVFLDLIRGINMAAIVHEARPDKNPLGELCDPTCATLADRILSGMLAALSRAEWSDR